MENRFRIERVRAINETLMIGEPPTSAANPTGKQTSKRSMLNSMGGDSPVNQLEN
jgi:hypothetical protein